MVEGELQREGEVIHVIVKRCHNVSRLLGKLTATSDEKLSSAPKSRSDEISSPFIDKKHTGSGVQGKIFPERRNFR
jgi:error-prone DNA polymerase